jgi:hypothetical protein
MILIDNVVYLKRRFPAIWDRLKPLEENSNSTLIVQTPETRSGDPTLVVEVAGHELYVHSKYNPVEEAAQLIKQYENIEKVEHVFFYGVGLGYHIDAFVERYPDKKITLYEPIAEIMLKYLSRKQLKEFDNNQLKTLFVEENESQIEGFISSFVKNLNEELLLVQLPSYERIFSSRYKHFSDTFKQELYNMKSFFDVFTSFEKRWTYNSMLNFETTLKTPNILIQKKKYFQDKPVIIVAAGPSLHEEMENLKYIKKHGLAYLFTVGTAINALIANGLEPDAACSFDPSSLNAKVFERLHLEGNASIPLIYGTSIAYEVLRDYLGPKLHMITSQDEVSRYYLRSDKEENVEFVQDAASIAIVTLQLLCELKCAPIILVGQNLAHKDNLNYSQDANVINKTSIVSAQEKARSILVESVDGDLVETTKELNIMRIQMEMHAKRFSHHVEIINTTNGGAKIANTTYMPLQEIIKHRLLNKVVEEDWHTPEDSCYDPIYAQKQADAMEAEKQMLLQTFELITRLFKQINSAADRRNLKELAKLFPKFDKLFSQMLENKFFIYFIKPMNKVFFELLLQKIEIMRTERDLVTKAQLVIKEFGRFVYHAHSDTVSFDTIFTLVQNQVIPKMKKKELR